MRPEDTIQAAVSQFLDAALPSTAWWTATANGAWLGGDKRRRMIQAARMKRTGVKSGTPDIIICHEGRFLAIELKAKGGKMSEAQMIAEDAITAAGGGFAVCRSVQDVETVLRDWLVPLKASVA